MARAPWPASLPGEFFVLVYDRDAERFRLYVDDAEVSSYDLGNDIQTIMRYFRQMEQIHGPDSHYIDLTNRAIDIAKEFGTAQAIFKDRRVLIVRPPPSPGHKQ